MGWVFVYGSLRPGASNFSLVAPYVQETLPAYVEGKLYHLPTGYPTVICGERGKVRGELLRLEPFFEALSLLDELEDYYGPDGPDNEYERIWGRVFRETGETSAAYFYVCPAENVEYCRKAGLIIPTGDWKAFLTETPFCLEP